MTDNLKSRNKRVRAAPSRFLRRSAIVCLCLGLVVSVVAYSSWSWPHLLLRSAWFPVHTVEIEGEFKHLSQARLQSVATPIVTGSFFEINLNAVRSALMEMSWVEDVTIRRKWPRKINIRVEEKKPIARWGVNRFISESGRVFRPDNTDDYDDMPRLVGPEGQHLEMLAMLDRMQILVNRLELDIFLLTFDERHSWRMNFNNELELRLGRKNVMDRLHQFIEIFSSPSAPNLKDMKYIDMRYTNGFSVSWKHQVIADIYTGHEV